MNCFYVVGIKVSHRHANAAKLQEQLTKYGCQIKLRIGQHETTEESCSDEGLIILQVCGEKELLDEMVAAFNQIAGISAKMMDLN
ncbi:MAG: hypothetical protein GX786_08805 [Clostridiales bacterium]|nr:hypothetical protein [Clostridiales bacterium]